MNRSTQARPGHTGTRLTRIAVTIGMVLASTGAAITTATPAHAAVVEVAVPGAGLAAQSATAECLPGEFLSGAGGGITGGGDDVTLTDIIPDVAAGSVTVWGHTNSPAIPAYTVVAQAICVPGPAPANYQLVSNTTGSIVDDNKVVAATCPAGTQVLGTGYEIDQAFGKAFPRWNYPDVPLTNNTVVADAMGALVGNPWELIAYAICATPSPLGAAPFRTANASAASSADSKTETTADCPATTPLTTGVGAATASTAALGGFVFINEISTNLAQERATARAVEGVNLGAGDTWYAVAANICWDL
jgi:hypothetical protein